MGTVQRRAITGGQHAAHIASQAACANNRHRQQWPVFCRREAVRAELQRSDTTHRTPVHPHQLRRRHPVKGRKLTTKDNPVIVELHQRRLHIRIRAKAEVDGRVSGSVLIQPCHSAARESVDRVEPTAQNHSSVGLHRDGVHEVVSRGREKRVECSIGAKLGEVCVVLASRSGEETTHQHVRAELGAQAEHRTVQATSHGRRKSRVHCATRAQLGQTRAGDTIEGGEVATHINTAVTQHHHSPDNVVRSESGIEARVQRAIRIQSCDEVPAGAVDGGELAANDHLVIRLQRQRIDLIVGAGARVEGQIQGARTLKAGDKIPGSAHGVGEETGRENASVRLHRHCTHRVVHATLEGVGQLRPGDGARCRRCQRHRATRRH